MVRLATSKVTREAVAIKSVQKAKSRSVELLKNEIKIMQTLAGHPNVIALLDQFEEEAVVHLVMELCTGGELFERIVAAGHFHEPEAAHMMRTILLALKHCHDASVVHRDLKPENFIFTSRLEGADLKMIDFGLSRQIVRGEILRARVGTPYYIAPEVLEKAYEKPCDLWSVGVMVYIMLCGYPPFWGDRDAEIFKKVRRGHFSFEGAEWDAVSEHAKDFIEKLLTMNPFERCVRAERAPRVKEAAERARHNVRVCAQHDRGQRVAAPVDRVRWYRGRAEPRGPHRP